MSATDPSGYSCAGSTGTGTLIASQCGQGSPTSFSGDGSLGMPVLKTNGKDAKKTGGEVMMPDSNENIAEQMDRSNMPATSLGNQMSVLYCQNVK